jgi:tripartite-type tricarboxylate transporter receptor subunit TctC
LIEVRTLDSYLLAGRSGGRTTARNAATVSGTAGSANAPAVVEKLNTQVASIMRNAEVIDQFGKLGISPRPLKPEEFARFVRSEITAYQRIVKQADIQLQ